MTTILASKIRVFVLFVLSTVLSLCLGFLSPAFAATVGNACNQSRGSSAGSTMGSPGDGSGSNGRGSTGLSGSSGLLGWPGLSGGV